MYQSAPFAAVYKRKTLMVLDDSEVRCPRKSPLGDVVSVVRCADTFEVHPEGCRSCQQHVESGLKAEKLRRETVSTRKATQAPRIARFDVV